MAKPTPSSKLNSPSHSALHNTHLNVMMFGAVGDGVADDTAAINAAINAVVPSVAGGSIFFPPGAYKVTSKINLTGKKTLHFLGGSNPEPLPQFAYPPLAIINGTSLTDPVFYQDGSSATKGNLVFENLAVQAGRTGFAFSDTDSIKFKNVAVTLSLNDGHADNCAILMTNSFWGWYEGCALSAPSATKHAVILRGAVTGGATDQSGLQRFRDCNFAGGAVNVQFNKQPNVGGQWYFENCLQEGGNTGLLKITQSSTWTAYHVQGIVMINTGVADSTAGTDHPIILLDAPNATLDSPVLINVNGGATASGIPVSMIIMNGVVNGAMILGANRQSPFIVSGTGATAGSYIKDKDWGLEVISTEASNGTSHDYANVQGPTIRMGPGGSDTFAQVGISSKSSQGITWGPGTGAADTNLYRSAANTLKTDDTFLANVAGLGTKHEGAGTPTGGTSGEIRVGNGKLWVNDAGTWKSVAVA